MIILMGLPGSGKGTQGKMLADEHGLHLVSTGDLVRMYVTGDRRKEMLAGKILDDAEIIDMLDQAMQSIHDEKQIVLDGFPRTTVQAQWLFDQAAAGRCKLNAIIYLTASQEAVKARLQARGRQDDADDVITARFQEYERLTQPVLDWFREHNVPIIEINAEQSPAAVRQDIINHLNLA